MPNEPVDPAQLVGSEVIGRDDKLGTVEAVYSDENTGRPRWAAVKRGMFATENAVVPLAGAEFDGVVLTVPYEKAQLDGAPHRAPGEGLSRADEAELSSYYGVAPGRSGGVEEVAMGIDAVEQDHVDRSDERQG
jgi:hypothetical protein